MSERVYLLPDIKCNSREFGSKLNPGSRQSRTSFHFSCFARLKVFCSQDSQSSFCSMIKRGLVDFVEYDIVTHLRMSVEDACNQHKAIVLLFWELKWLIITHKIS